MDQTKPRSLTLDGLTWPRALSFISGLGMIAASVLTIRHFFMANYPATIFTGSFCDISAFFNCDSSAFSPIAQLFGVPLGYFGLVMGALVVLGTVIPSPAFERTNKSLSLLNVLGVVGPLPLLRVRPSTACACSAPATIVFSIMSFVLFWLYGLGRGERGFLARWARPSFRLIVVFGVIALAGAYGFLLYHDAKKEVQVGQAATIVEQYYELPKVAWPSVLSPYWSVKSTERFEDAPIRIVEYADFLCSDCYYLAQQMDKLKKDFAGKLNVVFQFFPLEGLCNKVVPEKANLHPGACEMAYLAAGNLARFPEMSEEIWANFRSARNPEWRRAFARKYGTEGAHRPTRSSTTSSRGSSTRAPSTRRPQTNYLHGIRSTPTMIINNRMIIGTLPYQHLKAIFQALVDERENGGRKFIENWVPPAKRKK